jgi:intein/homing endonuclease
LSGLKTFRRKQYENGNFPDVRLPIFIQRLSKKFLFEFLNAIFTADGSISVSVRWHNKNKNWEIRRRVEFSCKHPKLRDDVFKLMKNVGFYPRISNNDNITLERKKEILKFAKRIRFVSGVKIGGDSKIWKGFEKNQILDMAVKTFDLRKQNLEKYESKHELIELLKSFISTQ